MSLKYFLTTLFFLTVIVAAGLYALSCSNLLKPYSDLSVIALIFFSLFSIVFFKGGEKSAKSENKLQFSQFFMVATALKMFFSLLVILIYYLIVKPGTQYFIIPFFFIYFCYTVFEVYFLTKLGDSKLK
jgi:hypothetical protein